MVVLLATIYFLFMVKEVLATFVLGALLAAGKLLGIWGLIIAVPLAATSKVFLWFWHLKLVEP